MMTLLLCNMFQPSVQDLALEEEQCLILAAAAIKLGTMQKKRKFAKKRSVWVKPWLLRRPQYGQYEKLLAELHKEDLKGFKNFLRVTPELFHELVQRLSPRLEKEDTFMRKALEPGIRLAITLRYMATGDSYKSLQFGFRVAHNTICKIIPETCEAIISEYLDEVMSCPKTPNEWNKIASEFGARWNFHNTIGAIDGKHIAIRCPINGGSYYLNYKGFHSIVLLGVADANYKFIYVDVGANGACSDGGIFKDCDLYTALDNDEAGLPEPQPYPNTDQPMPYNMIGDAAFAMKTWLIKPYPHRCMTNAQRIFNYRLSRARRVVENSFGILVHR